MVSRGAVGCACFAAAAALCFLDRSALVVSEAALLREGAGRLEVAEAAGVALGGASAVTGGATRATPESTGSTDRAALQNKEQVEKTVEKDQKEQKVQRNIPRSLG